jgi:hypothetical protein
MAAQSRSEEHPICSAELETGVFSVDHVDPRSAVIRTALPFWMAKHFASDGQSMENSPPMSAGSSLTADHDRPPSSDREAGLPAVKHTSAEPHEIWVGTGSTGGWAKTSVAVTFVAGVPMIAATR